MGLEDYGLEVGCRADLVLVPGESLADAVVSRSTRELVLKRGRIVACDGLLDNRHEVLTVTFVRRSCPVALYHGLC